MTKEKIQPNINQEFIKEEIENADKGRVGMDLETDPIVENEAHVMVVETEEAIRITITIVAEIIDLEITIMENIRQTICTMIDLTTEGKASIKIIVKWNRNRSVSRECNRSRPRYRSTLRENSINRYGNRHNRSRARGQRSRTNLKRQRE